MAPPANCCSFSQCDHVSAADDVAAFGAELSRQKL
jgi:hypothetical protein